MKFLPEDKKKKKYSIAILVIAVLGIVYVNFVAGPPKASPASSSSTTNTTSDKATDSSAVGQSSDGSPVAKKSLNISKTLPFGEKIDDSILNDPKFLELKPSPDLQVFPEELGQNNLFGQ